MPLTISLTRSGAQAFFARALYVFFGKPIRFLLPVVLITTFGIYTAVSEKDSYRSVGSLAVSSETFLSDVTDARTSQFTFDTPASTISLQFNELMQTDGFAKSVVQGAGLGDVLDARGFNLDRIRVSVFATAAGDSLMRIVAVWDNPDWAEALATSAISVFKNWVIDAEVRQSDVAESYYDQLLTTYSDEVDLARSELETYLTEHEEPIDAREDRPIEEQLEIERLNEALSRAQERFDGAIDKRELSRLATIQSSADIDQRLNVLDTPARPTASESGLRRGWIAEEEISERVSTPLPVEREGAARLIGVQGVELELPGSNERWLEINAAAFRDQNGIQQGSILVVHDLTRIRQLENTAITVMRNTLGVGLLPAPAR